MRILLRFDKMSEMLNIKNDALNAINEFLPLAKLKAGDIFVIGCSSSEIVGSNIGKGSSPEAARAVFDVIYPILKEKGIYLAVQCCEHLNRAVIIEEELANKLNLDIVNAVPQLHAGGSFAVTAYNTFTSPVAVEHIRANAGMDIGHTLIGMHLKEVAVPVRISVKFIGEAPIVCARTRAKYVGGERALYNQDLA